MISKKRQKDMSLKDELPRSVGAQYVTGEEWRKNSRKNEEERLSFTKGVNVSSIHCVNICPLVF